jgi:hypothetical protein
VSQRHYRISHKKPYANRPKTADLLLLCPLSFSFDFVTEPLLDFVTGFTEATELFGLAAFLTRQTTLLFPRLKFGTRVKGERASQSDFSAPDTCEYAADSGGRRARIQGAVDDPYHATIRS